MRVYTLEAQRSVEVAAVDCTTETYEEQIQIVLNRKLIRTR